MKAGKSELTQGHMKKKMMDLQRQIKQTARDTAKYVTSISTTRVSKVSK